MSIDKNSDLLGYVDSEAFRKLLREQVLEYEFVNGRKIVSATYALKMEAVDPKTVMQLTEQKENFNDLKSYLLNINVKRAILEEIALINGDVTHESLNYLNVVKSFGFEAIDNLTHDETERNRKQSVYHNPINGSLLILDIEDKETIYKATIHCQGKILDHELFKNIHCQRTGLKNERVLISLDVKELLSSKMECLFKSVKMDKEWTTLKKIDDNTHILNSLKKSLNLINDNPVTTLDFDNNAELVKKITHRTKRTLQ